MSIRLGGAGGFGSADARLPWEAADRTSDASGPFLNCVLAARPSRLPSLCLKNHSRERRREWMQV